MTPNADDLIEILKKLVSQIDGLEGNVQGLVTQSHELNKEVQLTQEVSFWSSIYLYQQTDKLLIFVSFLFHHLHQHQQPHQYHNEVGLLNNLSESQPRSSLISALEDETRQIETLEAENGELRVAIEQHQQGLALIMAKYREQSERLERVNALEARYRLPPANVDALRHRFMAASVHQMVGVLEQAVQADDSKVEQQAELIERIRAENGRLKRLLLSGRRDKDKSKLEATKKNSQNSPDNDGGDKQ